MDHRRADTATAGPPMGQLYTTEEVAQFLRVSPRAVQVWIRDGRLTAVRYGRLLRIRQADLAAFGEVLPRRPTPAGAVQEDHLHATIDEMERPS
jgi:excisionase family DNA binding protein